MVGPGRTLDAGLHLLDRQLLDCDQRMVGKVDDLELTRSDDPDGLPVLSAILAGPGALAGRLGGRLGAWVASVHDRLHPETAPGPTRVPFGVVKHITQAVQLSVAKEELGISGFEDWVREHLIVRIPGSGHGPPAARGTPPPRQAEPGVFATQPTERAEGGERGEGGDGVGRIRLSALLGAEVFDEMGRAVGKVHDMRLVQDGPMTGTFGAALRLGLIVGRASLGARLGYDRAGVAGPFILRAPVQAMHRHIRYVPWSQIRGGVEAGQVHIVGSVADLPEPGPLIIKIRHALVELVS